MNYYENLHRNNISLPAPLDVAGQYIKLSCAGNNLYFTSGVGCRKKDVLICTGKVGEEATIEDAKEAARQCILNILSNIQEGLGDLNRVCKIVKILGFVASGDGFTKQSSVLDAASELLIQVFGEDVGCAARSAIGVSSLPNNQSVEIELVFLVK